MKEVHMNARLLEGKSIVIGVTGFPAYTAAKHGVVG